MLTPTEVATGSSQEGVYGDGCDNLLSRLCRPAEVADGTESKEEDSAVSQSSTTPSGVAADMRTSSEMLAGGTTAGASPALSTALAR